MSLPREKNTRVEDRSTNWGDQKCDKPLIRKKECVRLRHRLGLFGHPIVLILDRKYWRNLMFGFEPEIMFTQTKIKFGLILWESNVWLHLK